MALGGEVINLIGLDGLNDPLQARGISQVTVVEKEPGIALVRVLIKVVDACRIEERRAPLQSMHLVALAQEQLHQVSPVLACYACH